MGQTTGRRAPTGPAWVGVAVLAVAATMIRAADPVLDSPDAFWHWDLGRRIVNSGLPRTDPYSFLTSGREWVLNQWGAEAIFGLVDALGGLYLLAVFAALLGGAIVWMTGRTILRSAPGMDAVALTGLVLVALLPGSTLRGNLFTLLLLPVLLRLLREERPPIWLVGALFVLWANLHAAFLLGVAIVLIERTGRTVVAPSGQRWAVARRGGTLVAVAMAASLVTPYGPRLLASSLALLPRGAEGIISEWGPTPVTAPMGLAYTVLVAVVLVSLAVAATRDDLPDILVAVAVVLFGYSALRNMGPAAVVVAIVGARYVHEAIPNVFGRTSHAAGSLRPWERGLVAVVLAVGALAAVAVVPRTSAVAAHIAEVPVAVAAELDSLNREARVAAPSAWGPVIAVLTGPHVQIAVDGRLELYTNTDFNDQRAIERGAPTTVEILEDWCVTDVIASLDSDLHALMVGVPEWDSRATSPVLGDDEPSVEWFTTTGHREGCGSQPVTG